MNRGHLLVAAVSVSAAMLSCGALAQGWNPERNVELIELLLKEKEAGD